jgi:uncharacterized protein YndB with AHSA1/START domain
MRVSEKDPPQFDLVTDWVFEVPPERVWTILRAVEDWPSWWPSVRKVEPVSAGDGDGVGAIYRLTWQTALPYSLVLATEVTAIDPMRRIEVRAQDDVEGTGTWMLRHEAGTTFVRYVWRVGVTRAWMRVGLPLLRPAFAWNPGKVMEAGRLGLQQRIAAAPHG